MKTAVILLAIFTSSTALANRESGGRVAARAVYVNFMSVGAGIDRANLNEVEALIEQAKSSGAVVKNTKEQMGREGETNLCVEFNGNTDVYHFIKTIASSILSDARTSGSQRTQVLSGKTCGDVSSATLQDLTKY
jgi:hypothetical protein